MIHKDRNNLIDIARKYYVDGLSQREIARIYNISRPSVSNLLKRCREEKIVEIRIQENDTSMGRVLAERLKTTLELREVTVVPPGDDATSTLAAAGSAAADGLQAVLRNGMKIGLSWGSSLYHTVRALPNQSVVDVQVIQLTGSLGLANTAFDGFELAMNLSRKLNGSCRLIQAPVGVQNAELKRLLIREPPIADTLGLMSSLDLALVGVSSDVPAHSSMVREGFLDSQEAERIRESGGVGHICGLHFDENGRFLDIDHNERVVGIDADTLRKIPEVTGVACGAEKAMAILGAARGGLISSLVTDEGAALRILSSID